MNASHCQIKKSLPQHLDTQEPFLVHLESLKHKSIERFEVWCGKKMKGNSSYLQANSFSNEPHMCWFSQILPCVLRQTYPFPSCSSRPYVSCHVYHPAHVRYCAPWSTELFPNQNPNFGSRSVSCSFASIFLGHFHTSQ